MIYKNKKSASLLLTSEVFIALHTELIQTFAIKYNINTSHIKNYQLYGFDFYNEEEPSIKSFIYNETKSLVNGKYLYTKWREFDSGAKSIKLTREFVYIYFETLNYKDIYDYVKRSSILDQNHVKYQLALLGEVELPENNEYYIGHYYGEDGQLIKSKTIIHKSTNRVQWTLVYWESGQKATRYHYTGDIIHEGNGINLILKHEVSQNTYRSAFISIYTGTHILVKPYMNGVYCGFDRNDSPVSGEIIFQRVENEEDMEQMVSTKIFSSEIKQKLLGRRIKVKNHIPQNLFDLSPESRYAQNLVKLDGQYIGVFLDEKGGLRHITLKIDTERLLSCKLEMWNGDNYQGDVKIIANGEVINGSFNTKKIHFLLSINTSKEKILIGYLTGINNKNEILNGRLIIKEKDNNEQQISSNQVQELLNLIYPELKSSHTFTDGFLNKNKKFPISKTKNISGNYVWFYYDSNRGEIQEGSISINIDNTVNIISEHETLTGSCHFISPVLLSITSNPTHEYYFVNLVIFIGRYHYKDNQILIAATTSVDKNIRPISFKSILLSEKALKSNKDHWMSEISKKLRIH